MPQPGDLEARVASLEEQVSRLSNPPGVQVVVGKVTYNAELKTMALNFTPGNVQVQSGPHADSWDLVFTGAPDLANTMTYCLPYTPLSAPQLADPRFRWEVQNPTTLRLFLHHPKNGEGFAVFVVGPRDRF
jgi:hypothetical protein